MPLVGRDEQWPNSHSSLSQLPPNSPNSLLSAHLPALCPAQPSSPGWGDPKTVPTAGCCRALGTATTAPAPLKATAAPGGTEGSVPQRGTSEAEAYRGQCPLLRPLLSSTADPQEACRPSVPSLGVLRNSLLPQGQGSLPRAAAARKGFASGSAESGSQTKKLL